MSKHLLGWRELRPNFVRLACGVVNLPVTIRAYGLLFNPGAWWVGAHYSPHNRRLCVNLLPCFTLWYVSEGGNCP